MKAETVLRGHRKKGFQKRTGSWVDLTNGMGKEYLGT
jgi:hypothetical protein